MKTKHRQSILAAIAITACLTSTHCNREAKAAGQINAARKYYQDCDYPSAEIKYKNALASQPGHPGAMKGLGLALLQQGVYLEAARYLSESKTRIPADNELSLGLARALLAMGFVADCRKELLELLDRSPDDCEAILLLAETSLTPDDFAECQERVNRAKSQDQPEILLARALLDIRRGMIEDGSRLVARALQLNPRSAQAHVFKANLSTRDKKNLESLESMKTASEIAGPRSVERTLYASHLVENGRLKEARELMQASLKEAPDYLPGRRALATVELAAGNDGAADSELKKVLAKSPLDLEASMAESQILTKRKDHTRAITLLEKLDESYPSRPNVQLALAKACLAAGDFRRGAEMLDRVLTTVPTATEAVILRAGIHLKNQQAADAIRLLEPLAKAAPENRVAQDLLALAYQAANRYSDAASIVAQQSRSAPADPALLVKHGSLLRAQGKNQEAREALNRALELKPDMVAAVAQLASLDQAGGNPEVASSRVEGFVKDHPDSAEAHLVMAGLRMAQKDHKGAEASATRSLQINPDQSAAYGILVLIQIADGRTKEAIEKLSELIKRNPGDMSARMYRATLMRESGDADAAKSDLEELLKIDPAFASAYNDLAWLELADPKLMEQAWEHARKARNLRPNDPSIADTYGWIQFLRGEYRQSLTPLGEAAGQLPDNPTVRYHQAAAQAMMYQIPDAIASLKVAISAHDSFAEKPRAEELLPVLEAPGAVVGGEQRKFREKSPELLVSLMAKADQLKEGNRPSEAADTYQQVLAINPELAVAHLGLAQACAYRADTRDCAMRAALRARELAPDDPHAAAVLGALMFRSGKHREANSLLEWAAGQLPEDPKVQLDHAWSAYSIGNVEKARRIMESARTQPSVAGDAMEFLLLTSPNASDNPEALSKAESQLKRSPDDVPALMLLASRPSASANPAEPTYLRILDVYPSFVPAKIALAEEYLANPKKWDEADKLVAGMGNGEDPDPRIRSVAALVNFRKGRFDYAAELLKELSASRSLRPAELYALGMAMAATRHPDEARLHLSKALEAGLPEPDAAMAKSTLKSLGDESVK